MIPTKKAPPASADQVRALDATEDDLIGEGETVDDDEPVAEEADVDLTDDEDDIADESVFDDDDEPANA